MAELAELVLSVLIPSNKLTTVINGVARQNGWAETVENEEGEIVENPVSKGQWIKNWILEVIRASWRAWCDAEAKRTAIAAQTEDGSDFS